MKHNGVRLWCKALYPNQPNAAGLTFGGCLMGLILPALALLSGCSNQPTPDASTMLATASDSVVAVGHNGATIGSAFAISPNHFATSHHIAANAAIYLIDKQGNPVAAKRVAENTTQDIAILYAALSAPYLLPASRAQVGTTIYALGNPFGLGLTASRGIVSAQPESIRKPHLLQIDAAINPGNSGGPIVNSAGQVIGLVSSRAALGSGIAFAVPINHILSLLQRATAGETVAPR